MNYCHKSSSNKQGECLILLRNEANNLWNDSQYNDQVPLIN